MEKPLQILFVGDDDTLPQEAQEALGGIANRRTVAHFAANPDEALEVALSRHPHLICLQMDHDNRELISFAREMRASLPETVLTAMYSPLTMPADQSESAIIIDVLRANVLDFLRRPLSSTEMRQLLDRLFQGRVVSRKAPGSVVSFVSNKGGVGKSTLAVNTACSLAKRHPGQVLLIDASLQLGIAAMMLDIAPQANLSDAVREKDRLDDTLLRRLTQPHESGLHLLAAPKDAVEAAEVNDADFARVLNIARRSFDYIVVDTFPMIDSLMLSLLDVSELVYIVVQGTVPTVVGVARFLSVLDAMGLPRERQRLVHNQNYAPFAGKLQPGDIQARLGRELDYAFPYRRRITATMNSGRPFILSTLKYWGFGREMALLTDEIENIGVRQPEVDAAPALARSTAI